MRERLATITPRLVAIAAIGDADIDYCEDGEEEEGGKRREKRGKEAEQLKEPDDKDKCSSTPLRIHTELGVSDECLLVNFVTVYRFTSYKFTENQSHTHDGAKY